MLVIQLYSVALLNLDLFIFFGPLLIAIGFEEPSQLETEVGLFLIFETIYWVLFDGISEDSWKFCVCDLSEFIRSYS